MQTFSVSFYILNVKNLCETVIMFCYICVTMVYIFLLVFFYLITLSMNIYLT